MKTDTSGGFEDPHKKIDRTIMNREQKMGQRYKSAEAQRVFDNIKFGDTFQNGGAYRTIADPLGSGLTFAVHEYASGADNESAGSETQDVDIQVEISIDLAPVKSIMSTSNASPIFKAGQLQ